MSGKCTSLQFKRVIHGKRGRQADRSGPHVGALRQYPSMVVPPDIAEQVHKELQNEVIDQLNKLHGRIKAGSSHRRHGKKEEILTRWTPLDTYQASRQGNIGILAFFQAQRPTESHGDEGQEYDPAIAIAPIFHLSRLFDDKHLSKVSSLLDQLVSSTSSNSGFEAVESELIAIHQNETIPGVLALLRAILRLDMWNGRGWAEVQLDHGGRFRRNWL